jgi:hypothetical protein
MAEPLGKPTKQKKNKRASTKPSRTSSGTTQNQPAAGQQDAGDLLRAAIDEQVKANSRKIAKAMVDKTIDGDVGVARLLVDFTGAKKARKPAVKKSTGLSWAQRAAAEPSWNDRLDPDDDTGSGGREPEV